MMLRLNLLLLLSVLVSAFVLVHTQYESRRLYTERDRAQAQARRLDADHEQLQVAKRALATPSRVAGIAAAQLDMRVAHPAITQYVAPRSPQPAGEAAR